MLTEIYISALPVNDELADQIWEASDAGEIDDVVAAWAWMLIAVGCSIFIHRDSMNHE